MNNRVTDLDWDLIDQMIKEGYVKFEDHPSLPLRIYNYTQKAQFGWLWNEATSVCRGLIADPQRNIVARPFPKFFEMDQLEVLPSGPFQVFDKVDGSLIVFVDWHGHWVVSTRGSFVSEQAQVALDIIGEKMRAVPAPGFTYLFEIIYPGNRIVINYGDRRELVMLAMIETATGTEIPWEYIDTLGFEKVKRFEFNHSPEELRRLETENAEGFVLLYETGERVKVKFSEYCRLHRILTGFNVKAIWEHLRAGKEIDTSGLPAVFQSWLEGQSQVLLERHAGIYAEAVFEFRRDFESRKEAAEYFKQCSYPALMFKLYDERDPSDLIWKMIKPARADMFSFGEEVDE